MPSNAGSSCRSLSRTEDKLQKPFSFRRSSNRSSLAAATTRSMVLTIMELSYILISLIGTQVIGTQFNYLILRIETQCVGPRIRPIEWFRYVPMKQKAGELLGRNKATLEEALKTPSPSTFLESWKIVERLERLGTRSQNKQVGFFSVPSPGQEKRKTWLDRKIGSTWFNFQRNVKGLICGEPLLHLPMPIACSFQKRLPKLAAHKNQASSASAISGPCRTSIKESPILFFHATQKVTQQAPKHVDGWVAQIWAFKNPRIVRSWFPALEQSPQSDSILFGPVIAVLIWREMAWNEFGCLQLPATSKKKKIEPSDLPTSAKVPAQVPSVLPASLLAVGPFQRRWCISTKRHPETSSKQNDQMTSWRTFRWLMEIGTLSDLTSALHLCHINLPGR